MGLFSFLKSKPKAPQKSMGEMLLKTTEAVVQSVDNVAFHIKDIDYFSQRDNVIEPGYSCYPTSVAMLVNYCLKLIGKDRTAIGCNPKNQIEDYLNQMISDNVTMEWMKKTQAASWWGWKTTKREIAVVEEYIFNRVMNPFGFKATFDMAMKYETYCQLIYKNKLPIVINGNFSSVSRVAGHVCLGIGYNKIGMEEVVVHDPFGNALKGYQDFDGKEMQYSSKFFIRDANQNMWGLIATRI